MGYLPKYDGSNKILRRMMRHVVEIRMERAHLALDCDLQESSSLFHNNGRSVQDERLIPKVRLPSVSHLSPRHTFHSFSSIETCSSTSPPRILSRRGTPRSTHPCWFLPWVQVNFCKKKASKKTRQIPKFAWFGKLRTCRCASRVVWRHIDVAVVLERGRNMAEREAKAPSGCYKCGQQGHWSRDCPTGQHTRVDVQENTQAERCVRRWDKRCVEDFENAR